MKVDEPHTRGAEQKTAGKKKHIVCESIYKAQKQTLLSWQAKYS